MFVAGSGREGFVELYKERPKDPGTGLDVLYYSLISLQTFNPLVALSVWHSACKERYRPQSPLKRADKPQ